MKLHECIKNEDFDAEQGALTLSKIRLPSHWNMVRLDRLFDVQQGKSLSPKSKQGVSPCPFLRTSNVFWGNVDLSNIDYMDFTKEEIEKLALKWGDLLVCEGGEIGRTAIWNKNEGEFCLQNHIHRLRAREKNINPEFYMFWMQAAFLLFDFYAGQANKTTIPNLSGARLKAFLIPVLPFSEQTAIANILKAVQDAKEVRQREITLERERKAALMEFLFTHGTQGGQRKQTEIGEIPQSWVLEKLGDIATIHSGGTPDRTKSEYWNGDIPWVKTGEINYCTIVQTEEKITRKGLENSSARLIKANTLLMAMYGQGVTRGRVAILGIDAAINQACAAIHESKAVSTKFLYYFLEYNYRKIRSLGHGANQTNLNAALIKSILVSLTSLSVQEEISRILNACDKNIAILERETELLNELFRAVLGQLVTGQLSTVPLIKESKEASP